MKPDLVKCLEKEVDSALEKAPGRGAAVFFRADDIAVPDQRFFRLLDLFGRFHTPLALAVVPTWIEDNGWEKIKDVADKNPGLWCWHQHGWRHVNHEPVGKKQEFGPSRDRETIENELLKGRRILEERLGDNFYPVFTPPWNRCGLITLELLGDLGYHAVSRHQNVQPPCPKALLDLSVNVDLHTRKEPDPEDRWAGTVDDLKRSLAEGLCGIMIHHQRMNDESFDQLEILIETLQTSRKVSFVGFPDLINNNKSGKAYNIN